MAHRVLLEVCVESVEDAVAASAGGADRIELNCALALDGLTPTPGLLAETRRAIRVPLIAMARPRAGDFCYSDADFRVLRRDVDYALDHGADGVAFGVLTDMRRVDTRRCRAIIRRLGNIPPQLVFHRAFDAVRDPLGALEQLIDLGFRRIMTSGGRKTAAAGSPSIRRLIDRAAGRIEILPAGGIRHVNARQIIARTGCDQLHTSLRDARGRMSVRSLSALVRTLAR
jgi:copper homeostasis protein